MTHRWVRTAVLLGGLVLAGTVVAAPVTKSKPNLRGTESDVPNQRTFEVEGEAELSRLCADKMRTQLPLSSVPTSNLALNDITVLDRHDDELPPAVQAMHYCGMGVRWAD